MVAFTVHIRSKSIVHNDGDSSDEKMSDNALVEAYKMLYLKWSVECKSIGKQRENTGGRFKTKRV